MQALLDAIANAAMPVDAQRLFHGRGGLYPGSEAWTLDAFPPVWLVTHFGETTPQETALVSHALRARQAQITPHPPAAAVLQTRHRGQCETTVLWGEVPQPHVVTEDEARYEVHLLRGQNHGLFLDMAEGRRWVRAQAQGAKVLNLFAYTCAFSVAALQGGAREVINLDMAAGALAIGRQNHHLNGLKGQARFLAHDLFSSWGKLGRMGPYDCVILDPPSHQRGSFVATKDWPRLLRRLPDLLRPGGQALLCLNAPEISEATLHQQLEREAPPMQVTHRLSNPPAFADVSPDRALKVLVAQWPALTPQPPGST